MLTLSGCLSPVSAYIVPEYLIILHSSTISFLVLLAVQGVLMSISCKSCMLYKVKYTNVSLLVISQLTFAHFHALDLCPLLPNLPTTFPRVSDDVK